MLWLDFEWCVLLVKNSVNFDYFDFNVKLVYVKMVFSDLFGDWGFGVVLENWVY